MARRLINVMRPRQVNYFCVARVYTQDTNRTRSHTHTHTPNVFLQFSVFTLPTTKRSDLRQRQIPSRLSHSICFCKTKTFVRCSHNRTRLIACCSQHWQIARCRRTCGRIETKKQRTGRETFSNLMRQESKSVFSEWWEMKCRNSEENFEIV